MDHDSEQVFYKLGELSEKLGVETSVLRFWEKSFPQIKPLKTGPRRRLYRPRDLELFGEIKRLLYGERFTIAGAQKRLGAGRGQGRLFEDDIEKTGAPPPAEAPPEPAADPSARTNALLAETRQGLLEIKAMLLARRPGETAPPGPNPAPPAPSKKKRTPR